MTHNHNHWISSENKNGLIISIILNSFIVVAEFIWWILSWSLALLSDAFHNLSDVVSLILSYIWELLSKKEKSNKYTFALKRAEVIIAFVNAITLIVIWFYIIYEAIERYFSTPIEINSSLMLIVWFIWLLWNLVSIFYLFKEKEDNLNKKSAYLHLLYDTISSVLVVIWWIIIFYTNWFIIDLIASIIISIFVIKSGFEILKQSLHILMQWVPANVKINEITKKIEKIKEIKEIHNLHIWSIDSNDMFLSAHIVIKEKTNTDKLIKNINKILDDNFHIHHTSLQIENEKCN